MNITSLLKITAAIANIVAGATSIGLGAMALKKEIGELHSEENTVEVKEES